MWIHDLFLLVESGVIVEIAQEVKVLFYTETSNSPEENHLDHDFLQLV